MHARDQLVGGGVFEDVGLGACLQRAGNVLVTLDTVDGGVLVEVQDDGVGFDVPTSEQGSEDGHIGLSAIRERCRMSGGWCRIESERGKGTTVRFWIPRLEAVA